MFYKEAWIHLYTKSVKIRLILVIRVLFYSDFNATALLAFGPILLIK